jgi:hypothetical protein
MSVSKIFYANFFAFRTVREDQEQSRSGSLLLNESLKPRQPADSIPVLGFSKNWNTGAASRKKTTDDHIDPPPVQYKFKMISGSTADVAR